MQKVPAASRALNSSYSKEDAKQLGYKQHFFFLSPTLVSILENFQKHGWRTPAISLHLNTSGAITLLEGKIIISILHSLIISTTAP